MKLSVMALSENNNYLLGSYILGKGELNIPILIMLNYSTQYFLVYGLMLITFDTEIITSHSFH